MPEYTLISFGQVTTFEADGHDQLGRRLYRRSTWSYDACYRFAAQLLRGVVCIAPDYETIVLAGRWDVIEDRPEERPVEDWTEPSAEPPTGGGAAADGDRSEPPLLTGGR